jgi:glycosyltransferase involved in cell wall biosynthesis
MKITVLSHNLSSNAALRAHRVALAARQFAEVKMIGPVQGVAGRWPALPDEPWIEAVREKRFPEFQESFHELINKCDGDVLIAVKPHLASFGAALIAREVRGVPLILDQDDYDIAFSPREMWAERPTMADLTRPASAVYLSLLTRASGAADAITNASTALQKKFGGTLLPHGSVTELFDPAKVDREAARKEFGFTGRTVLFPGTPRLHKGLRPLAKAVSKIRDGQLAVFCREEDLREDEWKEFPILRLPLIPYPRMPEVLAAADVLAIPQLDVKPARYQMPMKVYDCMAMGRPIVASAVSDLPRVLDGCARLIPADDARALRTALKELIKNKELALELGTRAREKCQREYSMAAVGKILQGVVEQVLAEKK